MANRLFINGVDVTPDIKDKGLDNITIELGLNAENKTIGRKLSSKITVLNDAYQDFKQTFFDSCDSWQNTILGSFRSDICNGLSIPVEITSEGVEWCPANEEIEFDLRSDDEVNECYNRLDSELITDNGFIENNDTPVMYYAEQPNFLQYVLLLLTVPIRIVFQAVETALKTVTLFLIPFDFNEAVFGGFDTWVTGLGKWTVAPLIREMIEYQCQQCNLEFSSSILNSPDSDYYNLSMFCLTGGVNGNEKDKPPIKANIVEIFEANKPLYTSIQLLGKLAVPFRADYRIIDDVLYFESDEFFTNLADYKLLNTSDYCLDDPICISWNVEDACAYGDYRYQQDSYDGEGQFAMKVHYQKLVEYNDPYNPAQKGTCDRAIEFAPARFMFDAPLYKSGDGVFNFKYFIDEFRDGPDSLFAGLTLHNEGRKGYNELIISSNILTEEKLLVLEPDYDRKDAKVIKIKYATRKGKQYYSYNYPMHLDEEADYNELIKNFLYLDNPRLEGENYKISDFEIDCDCSVVNQAVDAFQKIYVEVWEGQKRIKAIASNIEIEFKDKKQVSIKFKNLIGTCD